MSVPTQPTYFSFSSTLSIMTLSFHSPFSFAVEFTPLTSISCLSVGTASIEVDTFASFYFWDLAFLPLISFTLCLFRVCQWMTWNCQASPWRRSIWRSQYTFVEIERPPSSIYWLTRQSGAREVWNLHWNRTSLAKPSINNIDPSPCHLRSDTLSFPRT